MAGGEVAIFDPCQESLDFLARGNTRFVLGSTERHPHDLWSYSVHTSEEALLGGGGGDPAHRPAAAG